MIHNLFPLYSILLIFKFLIYYPLLLLILVYCRRTERTILTVQGGQSQNDRGTSMCTSIDKERNVEYVLSKEKLEYSKSIIDDFYRESSIQRKDLLSNQVRNSHYVRVNSLLRPPSPYFFPSRFSSSLIHCSSSFSSDSFSYSSYSYSFIYYSFISYSFISYSSYSYSSYSYSSSYHSSYSFASYSFSIYSFSSSNSSYSYSSYSTSYYSYSYSSSIYCFSIYSFSKSSSSSYSSYFSNSYSTLPQWNMKLLPLSYPALSFPVLSSYHTNNIFILYFIMIIMIIIILSSLFDLIRDWVVGGIEANLRTDIP